MLSFSGSLKVFVAVEACDMRKGFNGLHALVTERLGEDPRARCAVCVQQPAAHADEDFVLGRDGVVGVDQAAGAGNFFLAEDLEPQTTKLRLTPQALAMLTDGVDLRGAKLRPWYERGGVERIVQK